MDKNYITKNGFTALKEEYDELMNVERPKVVEIVSWAAGNGDRSENGDYIYGKKRLREIDRRIQQLLEKMESAEAIDPSTIEQEKVVFGATVSILHEDDTEYTFQIVGEDEVDVDQHKLSWKSPVARAVLGKEEGDEAKLVKPHGVEIIEISKIEYK